MQDSLSATRHALIAGCVTYVTLCIHAFTLVPAAQFLRAFVLYPIVAGGLIYHFSRMRSRSDPFFVPHDRVRYGALLTRLWIAMPALFGGSALVGAWIQGSYDGLLWSGVAVAGIIGTHCSMLADPTE